LASDSPPPPPPLSSLTHRYLQMSLEHHDSTVSPHFVDLPPVSVVLKVIFLFFSFCHLHLQQEVVPIQYTIFIIFAVTASGVLYDDFTGMPPLNVSSLLRFSFLHTVNSCALFRLDWTLCCGHSPDFHRRLPDFSGKNEDQNGTEGCRGTPGRQQLQSFRQRTRKPHPVSFLSIRPTIPSTICSSFPPFFCVFR